MSLPKIHIQIPARAGSERVRSKNLRFLANRPLIAYAVTAAAASRFNPDVYINSDAEIFESLATGLDARFHRRPAEYATSSATGDDFTWQFIRAYNPEILAMVNPVCPFIRTETIDAAIETFLNSECDTLISCGETQMQGFFRGQGINLDPSIALRPTQENTPIQILNWAVTIWDCQQFKKNYAENQSGYLGTNRLLFPISPIESLKISTEDDFRLCDGLMTALKKSQGTDEGPRYWEPGMPLDD